jgi:hypothetical protein
MLLPLFVAGLLPGDVVAPVPVRYLDVTGDGVPDKLMMGHDGSLNIAVAVGGREFLLVEQELPRVHVTDVLVSDLDDNGWDDLYLVSSSDNVALWGDGTGRFRDVTVGLGLADSGSGVTAERLDLDADGYVDLLLHNESGDVLFWARRDGTFERDGVAAGGDPNDGLIPPSQPDRGEDQPGSGPGGKGGAAGSATGGPGGVAGSAPTAGPTAPGAVPGATVGSDPRATGASGGLRIESGVAPPLAIPPALLSTLDAKYVNDDDGEVDGADVIDGSLTGSDVSTSGGDVTFPGAVLTAQQGVFGSSTTVSSVSATVSGGLNNRALADYATVSGGLQNSANGRTDTVSGGALNSATGGDYGSATVGGGDLNSASGAATTVSGGFSNSATTSIHSYYGGATVGGGRYNTASAELSTVAGGYANTASGNVSAIGGGFGNLADVSGATVAGGSANMATGYGPYDGRSTVGGGSRNRASGNLSTVAGGYYNESSGAYSATAGGRWNTASGYTSTVAGGQYNTASGGGLYGSAVVGGGSYNTADGEASTVGGGLLNTASGPGAVVSGGANNRALSSGDTVGGGVGNRAQGPYYGRATVAGGYDNTATGESSTISGGSDNEAFGDFSTVAGGDGNTAAGLLSMAAGHRATATHDRSFVWNSGPASLESTASDQFLIGSPGGVGVGVNDPGNLATSPSVMLDVGGTVRSRLGGFEFPDGSVQLSASGGGTGGLPLGTSGDTLRYDGVQWEASSVLVNDGTLVGVNQSNPIVALDVGYSSGQADSAVRSDGVNGPTRGYLAAQGTTDYDGIPSADWSGMELGIAGISTGSSSADNIGLLGHSNGVGVRGEYSGSPSTDFAELGLQNVGIRASGATLAGWFLGDVEVDGSLDVEGSLDVGSVINGPSDTFNAQSSDILGTIWAHNDGNGSAARLSNDGSEAVLDLVSTGTGSYIYALGGIFEVKHSGRVVTTALQITGGGDLVEGFETEDEDCEPGTVMVVDRVRPGKLTASTSSYDRTVVGVVSGAGGVEHGIRMGQRGVLDGDTLVAMAGRVYVRCTTESGPIVPGDRLTSSSTPGHAMKAADPARCGGSVVGKALTHLAEGTGLVQVLVDLQ